MDTTKKSSKKLVQAIVIIALMLGFRLIPPIGPLTPVGMEVLGIFFGCIVGWACGEQIWPSFLAVIMLGMVDGTTVGGSFTAALGNTTVHMVLLCMLLCYEFQASGMIDYLTRFILSRKFAQKSPWMLLAAFWIAGAVSCGLTNGTVVIVIILWNMFYNLVDTLKLEKDSPYVAIGIIGIAITCYLGGNIMPYSSFTQICFGVAAAANPDVTVNYTSYIALQAILTFALIPLLIAFCKYVLRVKIDYAVPDDLFGGGELKMDRKVKYTFIYIAILVVLLVVPFYLPKTLKIVQLINQLGLVGTFALILVCMALTPDGEGGKLVNLSEAFSKGVPYGLICIVATALTMAGQLTSEATGIPTMLTTMLAPITNIGSPYLILVIFVILGTILTNIINNIVCATIMIPVGMALVATTGINPAVMIALFCMVLQQGIVVPSGSVFGALLHGIDGYITSKSVYKYGVALEIVIALFVGFIGTALANLLF